MWMVLSIVWCTDMCSLYSRTLDILGSTTDTDAQGKRPYMYSLYSKNRDKDVLRKKCVFEKRERCMEKWEWQLFYDKFECYKVKYFGTKKVTDKITSLFDTRVVTS